MITDHDLSLLIADEGRWEEFYQKNGNFFMYDYHKRVRLSLEKMYRDRQNPKPKFDDGFTPDN
jgi:hypothetical protein